MREDMQQRFASSSDSASGVPAGAFPLSAAQRGIWFAQHLAGSAPISIAQYVEVIGALDVAALSAASVRSGREFGSGFLRLIEVDGVPFQLVDESLSGEPAYIDMRGEADPDAAAQDWMRAEFTAPLHILRDRVVNAAVLQIGDNHYYWYSRIHHIALDGFAAMTLVARTAELYSAAVAGVEPPESRAEDLAAIVASDLQYRGSDRFEIGRASCRERVSYHV